MNEGKAALLLIDLILNEIKNAKGAAEIERLHDLLVKDKNQLYLSSPMIEPYGIALNALSKLLR